MQYPAFCSYSHRNAKRVLPVMRKLEMLPLPRSLWGKSHGKRAMGKHFGRMFLDKWELPTGEPLNDLIVHALDASEFLIVFCTPDSADSPWVNNEIRHFISTGRTDRIITLILSGNPDSSEHSEQCLPKAIRDLSGSEGVTYVSIDARSKSNREIAIALATAMLGDYVVNEQLLIEERNRRLRNCAFGIILFALSLFVVGGDEALTNGLFGIVIGGWTGVYIYHYSYRLRCATSNLPPGGIQAWLVKVATLPVAAGTAAMLVLLLIFVVNSFMNTLMSGIAALCSAVVLALLMLYLYRFALCSFQGRNDLSVAATPECLQLRIAKLYLMMQIVFIISGYDSFSMIYLTGLLGSLGDLNNAIFYFPSGLLALFYSLDWRLQWRTMGRIWPVVAVLLLFSIPTSLKDIPLFGIQYNILSPAIIGFALAGVLQRRTFGPLMIVAMLMVTIPIELIHSYKALMLGSPAIFHNVFALFWSLFIITEMVKLMFDIQTSHEFKPFGAQQ